MNESCEDTWSEIVLEHDDLLLGYKKGDRVRHDACGAPPSGTIVVVRAQEKVLMCRYECIGGVASLWPPPKCAPGEGTPTILGRALEFKRRI